MRMGVSFAVSLGIILFLGWISNELGVTQPNVVLFGAPPEPGGGSFIDNIIAPFKWAWDAVSGYVQIMTFQGEGLPPIVVIALFWPTQIMYGYFVFRMIRGGG